MPLSVSKDIITYVAHKESEDEVAAAFERIFYIILARLFKTD